MKFLKWVKDNANLVSFIIGAGFIGLGQYDAGIAIIQHGSNL